MTRKTFMAVVAAGIALFGGLVLSYCYMSSQSAAACDAASDWAACQEMIAQIQNINRQPTVAKDRERLADEMATLIEKSAKAAGISPQTQIVGISPEGPQRVEESVYKEKPTSVLLKNVTLQQLVTMVHGLTSSGEGLSAKFIRIGAPSPEDTGNLWTAELTVTYLIYDPVRPDHKES